MADKTDYSALMHCRPSDKILLWC